MIKTMQGQKEATNLLDYPENDSVDTFSSTIASNSTSNRHPTCMTKQQCAKSVRWWYRNDAHNLRDPERYSHPVLQPDEEPEKGRPKKDSEAFIIIIAGTWVIGGPVDEARTIKGPEELSGLWYRAWSM